MKKYKNLEPKKGPGPGPLGAHIVKEQKTKKNKHEKIQMMEIIQNIHKNDGIDHNFNMVLSILNINNSINTNFSPACSL